MQTHEIRGFVQDYMNDTLDVQGNSLWKRLVESSGKYNCVGCDGLLLSEVIDYITAILEALEDDVLYPLWEETENGIMSMEQGFNDPDRYVMIHDINLQFEEDILNEVCQDARRHIKINRKRSK